MEEDKIHSESPPTRQNTSGIRRVFEGILKRLELHATQREKASTFNKYLKSLGLEKGRSYGIVLDVGARFGYFGAFAHEHNIFPNTRIKSVDNYKQFVDIGKSQGADLTYMDALNLEFPDATFDTRLSNESLPDLLFDGPHSRLDAIGGKKSFRLAHGKLKGD